MREPQRLRNCIVKSEVLLADFGSTQLLANGQVDEGTYESYVWDPNAAPEQASGKKFSFNSDV